MKKQKTQLYLRRFWIILFISTLASYAISEVAFLFQYKNIDRGPMTVELVIPAGTADRIDAGEEEPTIPEEMIFVLGDVLQVVNQDDVAHELGPLVVPAGATASLPMDNAESYAYSCSFKTSNYLGLDVREPTDLRTRLLALLFAAPSTAAIAFLYSLAIKPIEADPKLASV